VRTQPIPSRSSSLRTDRLPQMRASLLDRGVDEPVVQALLRQVEEATDVDLLHMAPFGLARVWGLPDDAVLRAFLYATRDSWMTLQWSLICPSCQGANAEVNDLARLAFEAHCPSCNIRYDATFSESVQVTFRPAKRLRPVEEAYVCVGGPGRTDHIRSAANVGPEETVELVHSLPQDDVPMRLRVQATGAVMEQPEPGEWAIQSDALVWRGPGDGITVQNDTEELQRVVYERSEIHGFLSAEVVTRHPLFRDLLSSQLIAPGTQIELQPLAFLFTDLKGSTALYEALGDAGAFEAVQSHFVLLREVLEAHAGTEVKTIGDAIMAVFGDPDQAISAAIAMQRAIQQNTRLALKVGVHFGRAMAVTFNRRLDYFGSAVNMAARLEGQSGADQIVCTAEMLDDPRVARVLEGFQSTREEVELKGIEGPMAIARIEVKR
jgi:class 3 adenylate cyclase